jgi:PKD repeat protein
MKTITKTLLLIAATAGLSATTANAQCYANFTWSQTSNNVVDFTNNSVPQIPNSTLFYWSFGDNTTQYMGNPSHTYSAPGTYIVCLTLADSISTCQATFCDTVTVYGNVICSVYTYGSVTQPATCASCADGIASATMAGGTGPYTYSWSSGGTSQTESGLAPGNYVVFMTDANGCSDYDTIVMNYVTTNCSAAFTWSQTYANEADFFCGNSSVPLIYSWNWGDNSSSFNNNSNSISHIYNNPGSYLVCLTVYDSANFCTSTFCDSVTVWGNVIPPSTCNADFIIYPDSINTSQAWGYNLSTGGPGMTYQWYWGDNTPVDYAQFPTHVYSATGSYNICLVVLDTANQCTDTMCTLLWVPRLSQQAASAPFYVNIIPAGPAGIETQSVELFTLFPNPASTEIKLKSDYTLQGRQFIILDVTGRNVIAGTVTGTTIDINALDKGMYIVQIANGKGGFSSQRFMKN